MPPLVPYAGTAIVIIGWVLVLIAIKYVSEAVQDRSIYNNAIFAAVLAIVGAAVGGVLVGGNIFRLMSLGGSMMSPSSSSNSTAAMFSFPPGMVGLIGGILAGLTVLWILVIIASVFLRRSFKTVALRLNVGLFATGALIYLIGSILAIIGVGFILIFIAQILFVIAFFSLPEVLPGTPGVIPPPPPPPTGTSTSV